jgi:hypothetical protein
MKGVPILFEQDRRSLIVRGDYARTYLKWFRTAPPPHGREWYGMPARKAALLYERRQAGKFTVR